MSESAGDRVRAIVGELEETIENWEDRGADLENKCAEQTWHIHNLADDLGKSRAEVHELKKQLKEAKELLSQLPRQKRRKSGNHEDLRVQCQITDTKKEPVAVFPEEIWSMIFGYLKEPQDLRSCYQSCTKFMWMLQDKRKHFLFVNVLKVLQDHVQGFGLAESDWPWSRSLSELPKCRLVCYGWKQSVDKFLQEDCPFSPENAPSMCDGATSQTALRFTHNKNPWNDAAMRELSPGINPMMSRFLMCHEDHSHKWRSPQNDVILEFLRKFGHHVWFLKVTLRNSVRGHWYSSLLAWLEMMPNLKALSLSDCDYTSAEVISQNPFPTIPTMKTVALVGCSFPIMDSILTANPHVERLLVRRYGQYYYNIGSFKLEQLKEMSYDDIRCGELSNGNWNLRKLTLEYKDLAWSELFQTLEKEFGGGTLVELNLGLDGPNPESCRLNLPKLRILSLKIDNCFNSIDFILPLVNLEYLKVELTGMSRNYELYVPISNIVETIEFHQYTHCLKDSNIWRLFPKLKKVSARTDRGEPRPYHDDTEIVDSEWQHCSRNEANT